MAAETQAFINEVKAPTHATPAAIRATIQALVPNAGAVAEQVELWSRLLQMAEMAEDNPAINGMIEEGFQQLGATRREAVELLKTARKLDAARRGLVDWYARFRQAAQDAGYTV